MIRDTETCWKCQAQFAKTWTNAISVGDLLSSWHEAVSKLCVLYENYQLQTYTLMPEAGI